MDTQKYMFYLYYVKSGIENEFVIFLSNSTYFRKKVGIFNWNSTSGKYSNERS